MFFVTLNIHDNSQSLQQNDALRSNIEQQAIIIYELKANQHISLKPAALTSFGEVKKPIFHKKYKPHKQMKIASLKPTQKIKSFHKPYNETLSFHKTYTNPLTFHKPYNGLQPQIAAVTNAAAINIESNKTEILKPNTTKSIIEKETKVLNNSVAKKQDQRTHNNKQLAGKVDYWDTVHSIESKQGKLLYRPRNKERNCSYTTGPCGHHQLTVQALKDIGCKSMQCRKDRLNYKKSLELSKKLLALNEKRLKKHGLTNLEDHEKYLIHQQGANGIKNIIAASKGKKELSKEIKKNMANNSPFSYKQLKNMGSKTAANKFMQHWKKKWNSEQRLVLASVSKNTNRQINPIVIPSFSDSELNFALNMTF